MKKLIVFTALSICFLDSRGQQTNPSIVPATTDYPQKSKNQQTSALVLLVGGMALVLTGISLTLHSGDSNTGPALCVVGAASEISSIPLFIASGKNKRRAHALSLSFEIEKMQLQRNKLFCHYAPPEISLRINL